MTFPNGKTKKLYSFATKYCSHHKPDVYPIYDDYINKILRYYRDIDGFSKFTNKMLLDYRSFHAILHDFQRFYKLESYTVKEIDQYLWQLGKANFPKKYWRCVYGKRKKEAKRLSGGDVHFVKITSLPGLALPLIEQNFVFVQFVPPLSELFWGYFDKVNLPF